MDLYGYEPQPKERVSVAEFEELALIDVLVYQSRRTVINTSPGK